MKRLRNATIRFVFKGGKTMKKVETEKIQKAINSLKETISEEKCSKEDIADIESRVDALEWVLSNVAC